MADKVYKFSQQAIDLTTQDEKDYLKNENLIGYLRTIVPKLKGNDVRELETMLIDMGYIEPSDHIIREDEDGLYFIEKALGFYKNSVKVMPYERTISKDISRFESFTKANFTGYPVSDLIRMFQKLTITSKINKYVKGQANTDDLAVILGGIVSAGEFSAPFLRNFNSNTLAKALVKIDSIHEDKIEGIGSKLGITPAQLKKALQELENGDEYAEEEEEIEKNIKQATQEMDDHAETVSDEDASDPIIPIGKGFTLDAKAQQMKNDYIQNQGGETSGGDGDLPFGDFVASVQKEIDNEKGTSSGSTNTATAPQQANSAPRQYAPRSKSVNIADCTTIEEIAMALNMKKGPIDISGVTDPNGNTIIFPADYAETGTYGFTNVINNPKMFRLSPESTTRKIIYMALVGIDKTGIHNPFQRMQVRNIYINDKPTGYMVILCNEPENPCRFIIKGSNMPLVFKQKQLDLFAAANVQESLTLNEEVDNSASILANYVVGYIRDTLEDEEGSPRNGFRFVEGDGIEQVEAFLDLYDIPYEIQEPDEKGYDGILVIVG